MRIHNWFLTLGLILFCAQALIAQTAGSLTGTVTDPAGAVVAGASVSIRHIETGIERTGSTNDNGTFTFTQLQPGPYSVTVTGAGFKRSVAPNVVVSVSTAAEINFTLEIGAVGEVVTVTDAQEIVNTTTPSLTNVINTRQVADLPLGGRNPVELAALQAGIAVVGTDVRGAAVSGLRQTAVNLTQDGINAMDNFVKTSSFFALTSPSLGAISEFSVTTGTVSSESGRGAAQVNMVTKSGSNTYHGGVFLQLINESVNANTFFNNINGTPKAILRQRYWGFDIGGPVHFLGFGEGVPKHWSGKDKAFFFFSFEAFKQNRAATRNRTVYTQNARNGIFEYIGTDGVQRQVNLFTHSTRGFAANPLTAAIIARTPLPNNTTCGAADGFNLACYQFNVTENTTNDKYVGRYDHQLVKDTRLGSHKLEFVYSRVETATSPDVFTNGVEAPFPGGVNALQYSSRHLLTPALVSTFGSNWTNVLRYGRQWAPVVFDRDAPPPSQFVVLGGITDPENRNLPQPRETIVNQITDNLSWVNGNHLWKFGMDWQRVRVISRNDAGIVKTITIGSNNSNGVGFTTLPGVNTSVATGSAILGRASTLYANLVGLLGSASQTLNVQSPTSGFVPGYTRLRIVQTSDLGLYAQDQWRMRSNFTLNAGVRWEFMGVPTVPNGLSIQARYQDLFGISGFGNLFNPNAPAGPPPGVATLQFVSGDTGIPLYKNDWNNFAPFLGFAYSPDVKSGPLRFLFGEQGKSSIRAGYSMSYLKDGLTTFTNALGTGNTNPGLIQIANQSRLCNPAATPTNVLTGVLTESCGVPLEIPVFKMPITDRENILANTGAGLWAIDPNIRSAYVHQYNIGFEREIMKDTALEIRYVGNRSTNLWRAIDYNDVNYIENGFLPEFLNAQRNLAIHRAAGCGTTGQPPCSFRNQGLAGQVALPIFDRFFGVGFTLPGVTPLANTQTYGSSTLITALQNNNLGSLAFTLANSSTYRPFRESTIVGLPANFFLANPNANYAVGLSNGGESDYNALQIEVRRRYSNGLQFQADYTWSKAMLLGDATGNNQSDFTQPLSLRNLQLDRRRSSQDQTQRFVANAVYDLPFGRGRSFLDTNHPILDRIVGGWTTGAIVSWSTGVPFYVLSGRTNFGSYGGGGADLVGITFEQFKKNLGVFRDSRGVFFVNPDLLDITVSPVTGLATSATLKPGLMAAPAPGTLGNFPINSLSGPSYFNLDLSVTKRMRITETVRFEFKTTAINVLNHANFVYGNLNFDSTSFGRITGQRGGARSLNFIGAIRF